MSWTKIEIGSLCDIKHGYAFKSDYFSDVGEFVLLTPGNFQEKGGLKLKGDKEKYYIGEVPEAFKLNEGDLLVVMTDLIQNAPILGGAAFVPEDNKYLHNQRLGKVVGLNLELIDKKFLYYIFNDDTYRGQIRGSATGATVRHTAPERIRKCTVRLPPLPTQRRIAAILSAYDDLIENNLRRIKLLEEAAQHIYREWFVRMRFPGWETVRVGADGLPEGWRKVPVEEIIEYHIGGGWGNDDVDGDYVQPAFVIRGTDIPKLKTGSAESVPFRYHTVSNFKSRRLQENDLVFEVSGGSKGQPVGRSLLVTNKILELFGEQEVICASFCKLIRIDYSQVSPYYFDAYILEIYGNGVLSQYENQSASNIMNFKFTDFISKEYVVVPSQPIQKMFDKLVQPLKNQIGNLAIQINRLKEARDILLPRLMNQTIEV